MYYYAIGYMEQEESWQEILGHQEKFTISKFSDLIIDISSVLVEGLKEEFKLPVLQLTERGIFWMPWRDEDEEGNEKLRIHLGFKYLYPIIIEKLCSEFGFIQLPLELEYHVAGFDLNDTEENDWYDEIPEIKLLKEKIQELLKDVEINENLRKI